MHIREWVRGALATAAPALLATTATAQDVAREANDSSAVATITVTSTVRPKCEIEGRGQFTAEIGFGDITDQVGLVAPASGSGLELMVSCTDPNSSRITFVSENGGFMGLNGDASAPLAVTQAAGAVPLSGAIEYLVRAEIANQGLIPGWGGESGGFQQIRSGGDSYSLADQNNIIELNFLAQGGRTSDGFFRYVVGEYWDTLTVTVTPQG